ncbi:MAG: His-Xaa-Ser system radical SAM maturase HxsB [Elusimicrobia bacterium]|nr:His-Xaa-Ser system radical SAM maturase HxsB [Elusimicrobiota bacterium]
MSRLTELETPSVPKAERVAQHNFRVRGSKVLVTNEAGEFAALSAEDYRRYLTGEIGPDDTLAKGPGGLIQKEFLRDQLDFRVLAGASVDKNLLDWKGPNVHTVVVTLRCNFKCAYCHASVVDLSRTDKDMSVETARQVVELIFQSPSPSLMIEFQGGEPLLNWPVVKFIVAYARKKNEAAKRSLHFGLISNFSLLTDEVVAWAEENGVSFCTSLDGPEDLHNRNRIHLGGNTYQEVTAGLRKIQERRRQGAKLDAPNAICTVTRQSLPRAREIVEELSGLGLERIQVGPLDPIGFAARAWDKIGYGAEEFAAFYAEVLDSLIELNRKGVKAYEKMALIFLIRILEKGHWRFPNADALCRLAYNHDGDVYTCEEGRLLANEGDEFFKIGRAGESSYAELLDHPTVRASLMAASPNCQPLCFQCAYNPYCTVSPVFNHRTQASLWGQFTSNAWCGKMMGIFDVLFERLEDPEARKVLESWLEYKDR